MNTTTDILVIGAGVMGITLALALKRKFPDQTILIIEKEQQAGWHASGRNSGVLHAGFYYTENSLKARFCREGNLAMKNYCREHQLAMNACGKLVVTQNESELFTLKKLYERGIQNGVTLKWISEREAKEIEPRVRTHQYAIFSPDTASVNPAEVMQSLVKRAENKGISFLYDEKYIGNHIAKKQVITQKRKINAGFVVNAAGLYADHIAKQYGFGQDYEIVPFKGLYLYSDEQPGSLKTHIYPVPDLNYPFLGVHFTVTVDGKIKIGPTAIPAFWREHYHGLSHFSLSECIHILKMQAILFAKNKFHFRQVAIHELKKHSKLFLANQVTSMLENLNPQDFRIWAKPGIRAQLIHQKTHELVSDFCYEKDHYSFHILNAVSPAFTCSFPFSRYLVDLM